MSTDSLTGLPIIEETFPVEARMTDLLDREWLLTNGTGSFASSSLAQVNTRRYHGWFIAALPNLGRMVMLPRLVAVVRRGGERFILSAGLRRFRLVGLVPEWEYDVLGAHIRQRLVMVYGQNTLYATWEHLGGTTVDMSLRPFTAFRGLDARLPQDIEDPTVLLCGGRVELRATPDAVPMHVRLFSECPTPFIGKPETSAPFLYSVDRGRGTDHVERQKSPGYFSCQLDPGATLGFAVTTESWGALEAAPADVFANEWRRQRRLMDLVPNYDETAQRLALAADQFLIQPRSRPDDEALARATGEHARSVIAGYPWFTDWGRDTMIALEGLTIATFRIREASAILRTFSHYVRDGLLPNLFPDGAKEGLYHTADATLWFFHAIARYLRHTHDDTLLRDLYPTLVSIIDHHVRGTRFGIGVDPGDGLLTQGAEGYQLTWMDAKVDGWVVTPRRGKAVEINALWFNALTLMAQWAEHTGHVSTKYAALAAAAKASFNRRFWNDKRGCLYDVLDPLDDAVRPNQIFAISLDEPVLDKALWPAVLATVERELLTPVGLRSLSPAHADFKATYDGDLRSRDAAYHQGTVWAYLIGHFCDAWRKTHGTSPTVLSGLEAHLKGAGIGQVSEIFDATHPYTPRGCYAQAWSTAELLRAWLAR